MHFSAVSPARFVPLSLPSPESDFIMSTLLFIGRENAPDLPADAEEIRSTVTEVDNSAPAAVASEGPDYNQFLSDHDTEGGLTTRQVASAVTPSMKAPVRVEGSDLGRVADERVNETYPNGGTAAAREASGEWGHGTLKIVEGIEPTIVDGQQFGGEYFAAGERPINATTDYMTAVSQPDAAVAATGADNARDAVSQSQTGVNIYAAMLSGFQNGVS